MADDFSVQSITDPFFRQLYQRLATEIDNRMTHLAAGSAKQIMGGGETVAERYASEVAHINALNTVIEWCREIQSDMYGARKSGTSEENT